MLSNLPSTDGNLSFVDFLPARILPFVDALAIADIFQGTLRGCATLADLKARISSRLNDYRRFLHLNDDHLNPQIKESKTDIGQPISLTVRLLKEFEVIGDHVPIFIHIDQYEELANIPGQDTNGPDYRRIINRGLARRERSISYRIGTRGHAWRNHGLLFGSDAKLEEERDYKFVDLDEILRRHETRRHWVFPDFAADVFARRLKHVGLASADAQGKDLLDHIFGSGLSASDKAKRYGGRNRKRSVKVDRQWPSEFQRSILTLADDDPLSARLLEAWVLQKVVGTRKWDHTSTSADVLLKDVQQKEWWMKERVELALVQIAGRCQQRPILGWSDRDR